MNQAISLRFIVRVLYAIIALVIVHTRLWQKGLGPLLNPTTRNVNATTTLNEIARSVNWAAKLLPFTTCLSQALTAQHLAARAGIDSTFKIGVRKLGNALDAHAWLCDGEGKVLVPLRDITPFTEINENIEQFGRSARWN